MIDHADCGLHEFVVGPIQGAEAAETQHLMREAVHPEIRGRYALAVIIRGPNRYQWYVVPTLLSLTRTK
jgi:hypothetical protein